MTLQEIIRDQLIFHSKKRKMQKDHAYCMLEEKLDKFCERTANRIQEERRRGNLEE